jgi:two-component system NtrC family sensor kinase
MSIPSLKAQISFQAKVLIPVILVMAILIGITMSVVNRRFTDQFETQAAKKLESTSKAFTAAQKSRADELVLRYRTKIYEPRFKAAATQTDANTTSGVLKDLIEEDGDANLALFTSTDARQNASAQLDSKLDVEEFRRASAAAIRDATDGKAAVITARVGGKLFEVASIPFRTGKTLGAVTFGVEAGESVTKQIKEFTTSEILFLTDNEVVASSLHRPDLDEKVIAKFNQLSAGRETEGRGADAKILLNNQHFLCKAGRIDSANGGGKLGYLLLSSYEEPLAVLQSTKQMLWAVSLLGMLLSTALVCIAVRKVTQPLRQLRSSAEAVGRGDFSKVVEVNSKDECGELAAVFNQMIERLKTSRGQLEKTVETLKSTQNQLIQSEKLSGIGEFVAGVAHELNNPLTSVMGFSELLQQSTLDEQHRRYLDMIFKSAKRCQKIVASLLSFARKHQPERKVLNVNGVVESAIEIVAYQLRTSNIEVTTDLDANLPATLVDPHQMQQVFLNIISNARQAMEGHTSKGRIRISTQAVGGRVRIIFQDNGPGISEENLTKLFVPFFTTKEVGKGTGLGLSLCYGMVTEHGGTITPQSKPGEGATFIIDLPITQETTKKADTVLLPVQPQSIKEGLGKRVLVVDDEDSILQMIREALTMSGYQVDVARDGDTALARLARNNYDLTLCDWKMPGLNGQQIYEQLDRSNPEMSKRLIFITGDVVNEKTQEFLKSRNKICLTKPFTLSEFRAAISRVLSAV